MTYFSNFYNWAIVPTEGHPRQGQIGHVRAISAKHVKAS